MTSQRDFDPVAEEMHRRLLERALIRIREGGHPLLRDLADGLLKGETTIDELTRSSVAAPVLQAATAKYLEWHKGLTPEEQEALVGEVSARVEKMRTEIAAQMDVGRV